MVRVKLLAIIYSYLSLKDENKRGQECPFHWVHECKFCAEICSSIEVIGNRIEKMKRKQKEAWNEPIFYTNDNVIVFDK